jgi:2-dehydropantoate 2-reductase
MKKIETVAILGLGAIGSMYAAKLHEYNPGLLRVIADSERISRYRGNGITINGQTYSFNYIEPENGSPVDLVMVAVKQHHLSKTIDEMKQFIGQDTMIISLLNGISSEEIIGERYGMDRMLFSFVVGTDPVREGTNTRFSKTGDIVFGVRKDDPDREKVDAVRDLFQRTGIQFRIPEDILREQWWKFMLNVGINQCSAILKAPYGVFQIINDARELLKSASREVIAIAQKSGIDLREEDIDRGVAILKTLSPDGKTSMLQDVEAGRKTEVEIFSGTVIELGRKYNVDTPVNRSLYLIIRSIEQMYS